MSLMLACHAGSPGWIPGRCTTYNWQISAGNEPGVIASYLLSVVVQILRLEESGTAGY